MKFTSTTVQTQAGESISQRATSLRMESVCESGCLEKHRMLFCLFPCLELTSLPSSAELPPIRLRLVGAGSTRQLWEPVLVCCTLCCVASQPYLVVFLLCVPSKGVGDGVKALCAVL